MLPPFAPRDSFPCEAPLPNTVEIAVAKLFSVRFDVDTHRCVREGMPALSDLGERLGVRFTFFVNMGRAVSRVSMLRRRAPVRMAAKLSALDKLGWRGYLVAAGLNPRVGTGSAGIIAAAHDAGHEIGLHGGRNHAVWQHGAGSWTAERLAAEIDAVLPDLARLLGDTVPAGFASPGWVTHPRLPGLLAERGFAYVADLHGPGDDETGGALPMVRTRLTGEPGGIAYLEHLRATGLDDAELERRFVRDLERAGSHVVVYDHPYFAGIRELRAVVRMVEIAMAHGYEIVPVRDVAGAIAK
jgi:peptidoglycan/xylan/chitin deacetylase (PgdA/CDA1 family)